MTEPVLPALDTEPGDGVYRHLEDLPVTEAEAVEGRALGERIAVDDDDDTGVDA